MSEGIYRKGGSSSAVVRLLETFRKDAWATQITRGSYSEHDVATVLRRFLRDLPEPILPTSIHDPLCRAIGNANSPLHSLKPVWPIFVYLNQICTVELSGFNELINDHWTPLRLFFSPAHTRGGHPVMIHPIQWDSHLSTIPWRILVAFFI